MVVQRFLQWRGNLFPLSGVCSDPDAVIVVGAVSVYRRLTAF